MAFTTSGMHSFIWQKNLVALRLVVLDKISSLPECIASLTERFGLQTQLGLDDGANNQTAVDQVTAKVAPHVHNVTRWAIEEAQEAWWEVDVIDLTILDVAHTLIVADGKRQ